VRAARRDAGWWLVLAAFLLGACGTDVVQLMSNSNSTGTPRPPCVSIPESGGPLCVYCGANYSQQQACLKCGTVASTSQCASCIWSDTVDGGTCQQCVDATSKISYVGCNELRSDLTPQAP
jgi:hypothetical protein